MSATTKPVDERAPLLGPQPSTVDASNEYLPDTEIEDDSGRIFVARAAICVVALGSLIFLQGMHLNWIFRGKENEGLTCISYKYLSIDYNAIYHRSRS
jgi:hypothetical protein